MWIIGRWVWQRVRWRVRRIMHWWCLSGGHMLTMIPRVLLRAVTSVAGSCSHMIHILTYNNQLNTHAKRDVVHMMWSCVKSWYWSTHFHWHLSSFGMIGLRHARSRGGAWYWREWSISQTTPGPNKFISYEHEMVSCGAIWLKSSTTQRFIGMHIQQSDENDSFENVPIRLEQGWSWEQGFGKQTWHKYPASIQTRRLRLKNWQCFEPQKLSPTPRNQRI